MFNINYTPAATINKKLNFLYFCKNLKISNQNRPTIHKIDKQQNYLLPTSTSNLKKVNSVSMTSMSVSHLAKVVKAELFFPINLTNIHCTN